MAHGVCEGFGKDKGRGTRCVSSAQDALRQHRRAERGRTEDSSSGVCARAKHRSCMTPDSKRVRSVLMDWIERRLLDRAQSNIPSDVSRRGDSIPVRRLWLAVLPLCGAHALARFCLSAVSRHDVTSPIEAPHGRPGVRLLSARTGLRHQGGRRDFASALTDVDVDVGILTGSFQPRRHGLWRRS